MRELIEELFKFLEAFKEYEELPEDFTAYDYSGGNVDDAYELGNTHGERWLATEVRKILKRHSEK